MGDTHWALRLSRLVDGEWAAPSTVASGPDWFVNWADFPSLASFVDGTLAANWRVKNGGSDFYAYDIEMAFSPDKGETWGVPMSPHRDGTKYQHGFVSVVPGTDNRILLTWLDARETTMSGEQREARMSLRTASVDNTGTLSDEDALDLRVCSCCQTDTTTTNNGTVVVYRDRSSDERRDISIIQLGELGWSKPLTVHEDGWRIEGCPVNGPAVSAIGDRVAVAWFTAAGNEPRVLLAFSDDGGTTFEPPLQISEGFALGRVDVVLLEDGSAFALWVAITTQGRSNQTCSVRKCRQAWKRGDLATPHPGSNHRISPHGTA